MTAQPIVASYQPVVTGSLRLAAAHRLAATADRRRLNRLAELVRDLLGARACQISLIDDVLRIVGGAGLPPGQVGTAWRIEDSICSRTFTAGAPVRIADAAADVQVDRLPAVVSGEVRGLLGVPIRAADRQLVGSLCVFGAASREWTDGEESLLVQLAGSAGAEIELAALSNQYHVERAQWDIAVDAAGVGTFDLDVATRRLTWDERMLALYGFTRAEFDDSLPAAISRVHPADVARVSGNIERAIAENGSYQDEYRLLLPDGDVRWIASRGRALAGALGPAEHLIGAAYDITSHRAMTERLEDTLSGMAIGYLTMDAEWRITYVNEQAATALGVAQSRLIGGLVWNRLPATMGTAFEAGCRQVIDTGQPFVFDAYYPAPLDAWYEVRAAPEHGGVALYLLDITARVLAQRAVERAASHAELLSRLGELLSGDIDVEQALGAMPELLVPTIGDWAIATVLDGADDPGAVASDAAILERLHDVGSYHADPALRPLVERYTEVRLPALRAHPAGNAYVVRTARSGEFALVRDDAAAAVSSVFPPGDARDTIRALDPRAAIVVPLRARGRTLGLITLCWSAGEVGAAATPGGPSEAELATLRLVADRAGLALDSAVLSARQRQLAEALQRSLLTQPPEADHLQIAVRYLPAAEAAQVGGDWYDAFLQPDGSTVLVIGDVLGHDTAAAAAMAQIRGLVRSTAVITGDGPADVLSKVDAAARTLRVGTCATAIVVRVEQLEDTARRRIRWSNAGHPPPVLLEPDGTVTVLEMARPNMLLGVDPGAVRDEWAREIAAGSTLFLCTDGLIERRDEAIDEGFERLRAALTDQAGAELDPLCDTVLARMLDGRHADDVAVIAVRLQADELRP